ncbi:N-acetylmuramidase family protein [Geitlerinema sp. PCC 7407]|uniref:N-acetylmuramidase domain-containing protein n=1 Tax=Geitlerinema sp. PCC 7407 TaxID=1173025 RepID=UPI00029F9E5C|nr:N-acetylmuramidase family protein [Geitlerinema sp. PCC 7407]AFY67999.1 Peptidoglycan-binding domain 1 protein [Geitlerinema sp. PCC 7407]
MRLQDIYASGQPLHLDRLPSYPHLVRQIQIRLSALELLPPASIDGIYGPRTASGLQAFNRAFGLSPYFIDRWTAKHLIEAKSLPNPFTLGQPPRRLQEQDYAEVAVRLSVEVAVIKAVVQVESSGAGFLSDGRPKILFEATWFSHFTESRYDHLHSNLSSAKWDRSLYKGGLAEWRRLNAAIALSPKSALKSASWGLFQIMGFNHPLCGYANIEDYVTDMQRSEGHQLRAFVAFIENQGLSKYLRNRDWAGFAYHYNGPSYATLAYDHKLASAYSAYLAEDIALGAPVV